MKNILQATIISFFCLATQAQVAKKHDNSDVAMATDTVKNKKTQALQEVIVTANKHQKPTSAARSGLKPMDLPQSVQVIDAEIIGQQQAIRLSDVVKNANGVYLGSARGGTQETFWSRGYNMTDNNMFKNGFRFNGNSIPEASSLEKVEFLKGGSALLYGNVTPGGIMNLVTKTPKFTKGGELTMQIGSYAFYKPSIDFYGGLNQSIAYRFVGSYEKSESFRDYVKNERIYINPSFLFKISDKTQIIAQGDYLSADWTPDFGTGAIGKTIVDVPRNNYYGALWSNGNTKMASASILLNHDFNDHWKLSFNTSFQDYDRSSKSTAQMSNIGILSPTTVYGNWTRALVKAKATQQIFGNQLSLQGTFKTGSIKHQTFTGIDYEDSVATSYSYAFLNASGVVTPNYDTINLFNFDPATQRNDEPNTRITAIADTNSQRFGGFAQDLISFTDKIKVLAGIRWSWQQSQIDTDAYTYNTDGSLKPVVNTIAEMRIDKAFTPKVGLIFQPNKETSLFASYSSSFTPNTGLTVNNENIEASIIEQYEAGVKKDFWKGLLSTNVTVYQITNDNLAQTAAFKADGITPNIETNIKELVGATKSKGVEIDITGKPTEGLNINAGYSFNETRITKTSGTSGSLVAGDILTRTPKHTANLSFFYKLPTGILKGLSFGAIGNYIGETLGGNNDRYVWTAVKPATIPATYTVTIEDRDTPMNPYKTVDFSVGYEWRKFTLLTKVSNITNEIGYINHENYSVNPSPPRQFMASLKYKF